MSKSKKNNRVAPTEPTPAPAPEQSQSAKLGYLIQQMAVQLQAEDIVATADAYTESILEVFANNPMMAADNPIGFREAAGTSALLRVGKKFVSEYQQAIQKYFTHTEKQPDAQVFEETEAQDESQGSSGQEAPPAPKSLGGEEAPSPEKVVPPSRTRISRRKA